MGHPEGPRPLHVPGQGVPDEDRFPGGRTERLERRAEDPGVGLHRPDDGRVRNRGDDGSEPRLVEHVREVSIEVRDDAETVRAGEPGEERAARGERRLRFRQEPLSGPARDGGVEPQPPPHALRHPFHDAGERQVCRHRADQDVAARVERRVEPDRWDGGALRGEARREPLLPGDAVGVERSAEVEEDRFRRHRTASTPGSSPSSRAPGERSAVACRRTRTTAPGTIQQSSRARLTSA